MVYIMLANGFEEIEAISVIDIVRRAELDVTIVGVGSSNVKGAHGITVASDILDNQVIGSDITAIVLPGGMPGTTNLQKSLIVQGLLDRALERESLICAICAAPSILGQRGLLKGRNATVFPGFEKHLIGANYVDAPVVVDGKFITAKGPASAIDFGLEIVNQLGYESRALSVREALQC